jgi:putative transposase
LTRYRAEGLVGLARQPHADRHRRHLSAELQALIEGPALRKPPPSAAFVHRQLTDGASRTGRMVPGYDVVYAIMPGLILAAPPLPTPAR